MLRILLISHTCQSPAEGQPKSELLHARGDLNLKILIPSRWKHYGKWRPVQFLPNAKASYIVGKVRWPSMGPALFFLHYYPHLKRILLDFKPDVIDLWEEPWSMVSAHTCYLRNKLLPKSKIISETEQNIFRKLPQPFEFFRQYTIKNTDYLIGRSTEAVDVMRRHGYHGPACTVPNGVDASMFTPTKKTEEGTKKLEEKGSAASPPCSSEAVRSRMPQASSSFKAGEAPPVRSSEAVRSFVVGYAGRLVKEKGLGDLVDAIALCPANVHLTLIGDGPFKFQLQQRIAEKQLADRVRISPGVPLAQLPDWMRSLNVFALPSRTTRTWKEQFGRVIIEAHACGIPVIGSNSGAIPEVIGEAGLVAQEGDPQSLAAAIRQLAANPASAVEMGRLGRRRVENWCCWPKIAEQMACIYAATAVKK